MTGVIEKCVILAWASIIDFLQGVPIAIILSLSPKYTGGTDDWFPTEKEAQLEIIEALTDLWKMTTVTFTVLARNLPFYEF